MIVALIALPTLMGGVYSAVSITRKRKWPRAAATIVSSENVGERTRTFRGLPVVEKQCDIVYSYSVKGVECRSNTFIHTQLHSSDIWFTEKFAKDVIINYPVGKQIRISYDPDDPRRSFIKFYEQGAPIFLLVGGVLILAVVFYVKALAQ
ncbi:DUF3592 domain-containing protein [Noviherbaspirillum sp.]|uniref:DUF3592 domain-containing protein n=1 Tax=Noviherbaspirillum sp. TaxID=1926288 RepID=UPI0025FA6016|nr:DUF3592 domain-containing protein [Noviherbaspirillum sp.]